MPTNSIQKRTAPINWKCTSQENITPSHAVSPRNIALQRLLLKRQVKKIPHGAKSKIITGR